MNKDLKVVIGKEILEFLLRTVEELAAKSGLTVAHHGAQHVIQQVRGTIEPYNAQSENEKSE